MRLRDIAVRHKADKVLDHTYLPIYEELLEPLRNEPIHLLEIGILNGGSLAMWLDWMPKAQVVGIDLLLPNVGHPALKIYACAQDDEATLAKLFKLSLFDVIVDDGSHRLSHQIQTMHYLWPALKPGGMYFVEDIQDPNHLKYFEMMPGYRVWDLSKQSNRYDDILVCLKKPLRKP